MPPVDRLADLMRQGFMRRAFAAPKPKPAPRVIVACDDCLNWHQKGKHTSPIEVRRARRVERKTTERMKRGNTSGEPAK